MVLGRAASPGQSRPQAASTILWCRPIRSVIVPAVLEHVHDVKDGPLLPPSADDLHASGQPLGWAERTRSADEASPSPGSVTTPAGRPRILNNAAYAWPAPYIGLPP